jgi:hypothetical protein
MGSDIMSFGGVPDIATDRPALYEIRVRGTLDDTWCSLMDGMTMSVAGQDFQRVTIMRAVVKDQAALAGLLEALFALNATVLSVEAVGAA